MDYGITIGKKFKAKSQFSVTSVFDITFQTHCAKLKDNDNVKRETKIQLMCRTNMMLTVSGAVGEGRREGRKAGVVRVIPERGCKIIN